MCIIWIKILNTSDNHVNINRLWIHEHKHKPNYESMNIESIYKKKIVYCLFSFVNKFFVVLDCYLYCSFSVMLYFSIFSMLSFGSAICLIFSCFHYFLFVCWIFNFAIFYNRLYFSIVDLDLFSLFPGYV